MTCSSGKAQAPASFQPPDPYCPSFTFFFFFNKIAPIWATLLMPGHIFGLKENIQQIVSIKIYTN